MTSTVPPLPAVCFLLGLPRSGTTLLAHLLQQHPELLAPPEPWLMLALDALGETDRGHPADARLLRNAIDEFVNRIDYMAICRSLADAAYSQYLVAAGKRCFIDKTPRYWMATDFIDALYPNAPQILLLRNPYAIAASLKSTWNIALEMEDCVSTNIPYLADLVLGLPVLAGRRAHQRTQVVHYETLVKQPLDEVRRLVAGLGYDAADVTTATTEQTDYLRAGTYGDRKILDKKAVDSQSVDRWLGELSVKEMQAVTDMVGADLLIDLGYENALTQAQNAGVIDKGREVTQRHRKVFEVWRTLRTDPAKALQIDQTANAISTDESIIHDARLLAETDTERRLRQTQKLLTISESDRAARLDVIHELDGRLTTSEADRAARLEVIKELDAKLTRSETDRAARLDLIQELTGKLAKLQTEHTSTSDDLQRLENKFTKLEIENATKSAVVEELEFDQAAKSNTTQKLARQLARSETDRTAKSTVIQDLGGKLADAEAEISRLKGKISELQSIQTRMLRTFWWRIGSKLRLT